MKNSINQSSSISQRGQTYLWMSYFLAITTVVFFLLIFGAFLFHGIFEIWTSEFRVTLSQLIGKTLWTFLMISLVSVPFAFLLTLFLQDSGRPRLRHWTFYCLRGVLRCPPVVVGVSILCVIREYGWDSISLSAVLSGLLVPRLAYGWHKILSKRQVSIKEAGLALGISPWQIFSRLFLPQHWSQLFVYTFKVFVVLAGAVAPFAYLASFTFMTPGPSTYFSLDAFEELVKSHDQSPLVWLYLVSLTGFTFLVSTFENRGAKSFPVLLGGSDDKR